MTVIILAAGYGSRLGRKASIVPKPLVIIKRRPLIDWVISFSMAFSPKNIIVVVGNKGPLIKEYTKNYLTKTSKTLLQVISNPDFDKGNILSLKRAIRLVDDDFLVLNADFVYSDQVANQLSQASGGLVLGCSSSTPVSSGDTRVLLQNGLVIDISRDLTKFNGVYQGITLGRRVSLPQYRKAITSTLRLKGESATVEDVFQVLAKRDYSLRVGDVSDFSCLHINNAEDLDRAEKYIANNPEQFKRNF